MLRKAKETEGPRSKAPIVMDIALGKGFTKTVYLEVDSESFEDDLLEALQNASYNKTEYNGAFISPLDCKVSLEWRGVDRKNIISYVQKDIDNYYQELKAAKELQDPTEKRNAELTAINRFIRKLHQSHYFPDGNGRTFVFLLANMLLLQNGHGLKITENPAHYAGYSIAQLLAETQADLEQFSAYKITAAKSYLANLSAAQINQNKADFKTNVLANLNSDPLIAMAQINELFIQINANKIVVPKGYTPPSTGVFSWFSRQDPQISAGHVAVVKLLNELYMEKLNLLVEQAPEVEKSKRIGFGSTKETPLKFLLLLSADMRYQTLIIPLH